MGICHGGKKALAHDSQDGHNDDGGQDDPENDIGEN